MEGPPDTCVGAEGVNINLTAVYYHPCLSSTLLPNRMSDLPPISHLNDDFWSLRSNPFIILDFFFSPGPRQAVRKSSCLYFRCLSGSWLLLTTSTAMVATTPSLGLFQSHLLPHPHPCHPALGTAWVTQLWMFVSLPNSNIEASPPVG